jgi:hypothetical protein
MFDVVHLFSFLCCMFSCYCFCVFFVCVLCFVPNVSCVSELSTPDCQKYPVIPLMHCQYIVSIHNGINKCAGLFAKRLTASHTNMYRYRTGWLLNFCRSVYIAKSTSWSVLCDRSMVFSGYSGFLHQ